jgi:hypothetical protein
VISILVRFSKSIAFTEARSILEFLKAFQEKFSEITAPFPSTEIL